MQMCPNCDKVYDESEYTHCPYCSGEIEPETEKYKDCPECDGIMYWDGDCWSLRFCRGGDQMVKSVFRNHGEGYRDQKCTREA